MGRPEELSNSDSL